MFQRATTYERVNTEAEAEHMLPIASGDSRYRNIRKSLPLFYLLPLGSPRTSDLGTTCPSQYAGLTYDTEITFSYHNDYWKPNQSESDDLWQAIDIDPIIVALSEEEIRQWGLPPSIKFPWDESKGIYYIQSYHLLHCLKNIRRAYLDFDLHKPGPPLVEGHHVYHCLDMLRQYVICHADDTPMPARASDSSIGDNQQLRCRNMSKLQMWTQGGTHGACFKMVDEFAPTAHTLEKYQFCTKDSPYYLPMQEYFKEHGHRQMFVDNHRNDEEKAAR